MILRLTRVAAQPQGAFGVLLQDGVPFAVTLERTYASPGSEREQFIKIPVGEWKCTRSTFFRGGYPTYEIHVPGRSRLLFHKGNLEKDVDGCVLVGENFTVFGREPGIGSSSVGFTEFMARCAGVGHFTLEVRDAV